MEKQVRIKYLKDISEVNIHNIMSSSDKSNTYRGTISINKLDNYIDKANTKLEKAKKNYKGELEMLEVIRKHEEIMQERFEEKYWFWITTVEEYIENMKLELDEEEYNELVARFNNHDKDDYVLDKYNSLDVSIHDTLEDAYFAGLDYNYGRHIYEIVLEELEVEWNEIRLQRTTKRKRRS